MRLPCRRPLWSPRSRLKRRPRHLLRLLLCRRPLPRLYPSRPHRLPLRHRRPYLRLPRCLPPSPRRRNRLLHRSQHRCSRNLCRVLRPPPLPLRHLPQPQHLPPQAHHPRVPRRPVHPHLRALPAALRLPLAALAALAQRPLRGQQDVHPLRSRCRRRVPATVLLPGLQERQAANDCPRSTCRRRKRKASTRTRPDPTRHAMRRANSTISGPAFLRRSRRRSTIANVWSAILKNHSCPCVHRVMQDCSRPAPPACGRRHRRRSIAT